ncbi:MAG: phage integrase SAM-like domain-containing protein [Chitinophagaceae bacterium]
MVDDRFVRKDGTCLVYIQYRYAPLRKTLLSTDITIPPKYWDEKEGYIRNTLPSVYGVPEGLNLELRRMYRIAEDMVLLIRKLKVSNPGPFAKEIFTPQLNNDALQLIAIQIQKEDAHANLDIFFQIDHFAQSKKNKVTPVVLRTYRNMKTYLYAFQEYQKQLRNKKNYKITFEQLDFTFYEDFVEYLSFHWTHVRRTASIKGLKFNTVGRVVKDLKAFLADRIKKKIIAPVDMSGWIVLNEEVDTVYMSRAEIEKMQLVDLSDTPHLVDYRDDFILGCLTGLRFSDFSNINALDIRGDFLYKKQKKSFHWVVIPLRPAAKQILERRFKNNIPIPTNPEFNRHIKTVAKLAGIDAAIQHSFKKGNKVLMETRPKYGWVCSHTCRRSFCTNEFLAGTPVGLIMKISGHKSEKDFLRYIRVSPEEAAIKIQEIWTERERNLLQIVTGNSKLLNKLKA